MKPVQITGKGFTLAAHLYLPTDFNAQQSYPAIVCVHPGGGVKEQTSGLYAELLAEKGFITLAFDAAYQGESSGEPRGLEDPAQRVEDISLAIDYLVNLEGVANEKIGLLGICAGGGYAINATLFDKRIKALATVSAVDINGLFRAGFGANPIPTLLELLNNAGAQRSQEAKDGERAYIPFVPNSPAEFNEHTPEYAKEAYDYYRTPRAQHERASNQLLFTSVAKIFAFDAFSQVADLLTRPTLLIVGKQADTAYFSENVFEKISHNDKQLTWIDGATHVSLYDKDVPVALESIATFFDTKLANAS
ncbi:MAG: alpha/beta hydrolase [Neisseria sp.]|uniref:alpha/beta hydrolase n=1 Tax=Neisseria sp. TaxID=192066 RepID=UPI0026DBC7DC|nr:alpha/beta hydrolase [Neisseria sp.]MDO4640369.1 alpha/beta hydrolase [Neisseria sp.]